MITLQSNESLSLFETDYIEDNNGVDGQVSITNSTGIVTPLLVGKVVDGATVNAFRGRLNLSAIANGIYIISGKAKDLLDNLTQFNYQFKIKSGFQHIPVYSISFLKLEGEYTDAITFESIDYKTIIEVPKNVAAQLIRFPRRNEY